MPRHPPDLIDQLVDLQPHDPIDHLRRIRLVEREPNAPCPLSVFPARLLQDLEGEGPAVDLKAIGCGSVDLAQDGVVNLAGQHIEDVAGEVSPVDHRATESRIRSCALIPSSRIASSAIAWPSR